MYRNLIKFYSIMDTLAVFTSCVLLQYSPWMLSAQILKMKKQSKILIEAQRLCLFSFIQAIYDHECK